MIGCGDVTEVKSGPAFSIAGKSQLLGVTSRTISKAQDYARRHGVDLVFPSTEELIHSPDIDAVYIATPPSSHYGLAMQVAAVRKPCCIEKPIAMGFAEAKQLVEAFATSRTTLFVAYYRRSLPRFAAIKSVLDEGRIGALRHIEWQLTRTPPTVDEIATRGWRIDPIEAPGGYFDDLACHGLNLFDFYCGPIVDAKGIKTIQSSVYNVPDSVVGSWRHLTNVTGSAVWNFSSFRDRDRVEMIGTEGTLQFSVFDDTPIYCLTQNDEDVIEIAHPKHIQRPHIENMVQHLGGAATHPSLGDSAARTAWVCEQILVGSVNR